MDEIRKIARQRHRRDLFVETTPNKIFKPHSGRPIPLASDDIQSANDIGQTRPRLRRYNNLLGMTFLQRGRSDGAAKSARSVNQPNTVIADIDR